MKHTLIAILLFCLADVSAQNRLYLETLEGLLSGSTADRSLKAGFTSDSLGYRRGLNPADPKFEIAYFFENRFEANLTVDLDMPSLYHQRNMLSKLNTGRAKAGYHQDRLTLLTEISDTYLELIYNTRLNELFNSFVCKDSIEQQKVRLKEAFDNGDINVLDYTDLQMTYATLCALTAETEKQITILTDRIRIYSPEFSLKEVDFPHFEFYGMTSEEFVTEALARNPVSEIMEKDSLICERQLKLAKWEWAPKIVIGTRLDMDGNRNFAPAAIAGLSIPLWENRGNIRHAKAQMAAGSVQNERMEQEFKASVEELYKRYMAADKLISAWEGYDIGYHCKKLITAYKAGRVTASDLYFEFSHIVDNAAKIMQSQLEQASCAARMTILLSSDDI